jgi:hypothetical protein
MKVNPGKTRFKTQDEPALRRLSSARDNQATAWHHEEIRPYFLIGANVIPK